MLVARVNELENDVLRERSGSGSQATQIATIFSDLAAIQVALGAMSALFSPFTPVSHAQSPYTIVPPLQVKFAVTTTAGPVTLEVDSTKLADQTILIFVDTGEDANVNPITFAPTGAAGLTVQDPSTGTFAATGKITSQGGNAWWQWDQTNNRFVLIASS